MPPPSDNNLAEPGLLSGGDFIPFPVATYFN